MTNRPAPANVDVSQVFLIYMALVGDADKTALALDLSADLVRSLAEKEGWAEKVRRLSLVSKTDQGDWERTQNRALNFVQVHQLRRRLDAELALICALEPGEAMRIYTKDGRSHLSARIYTDLAAAIERVHMMSYEALGDTLRERTERAAKGGDPITKGGLHSAMISAMNGIHDKPEVAGTLADEAQAVVDDLVKGLKSAAPVSE
jgi:hypothetical protein